MRLLDIFPTSKLRQELVTSLTSTSKKVGELIFSNTTSGDGVNKKRSSFTLEKDLSGSANLLLLTNYIVESSYLGSNAVPISRSMDAALSSLLEEYANNFLPPTSEELLVRRRLENESQLENELKDLVN